jgi:transcription initiation factor TFIID subunit 10
MPSRRQSLKGAEYGEKEEERRQAVLANQAKQARANEANRNVFKNLASLSTFLSDLDEYSPTVPEAVTLFYMNKGGVEAGDPRMVKLTALAADHFLAKTIYESRQICLLRQENLAVSTTKSKKRKIAEVANKTEETFQEEDLDRALTAAGVRVRRSKYKSVPPTS